MGLLLRFQGRLSETGHRPRSSATGVRLYVSEYILSEVTATLTEDLKQSRRFAFLARRAILRIAKLVNLPPRIERFVPGDPNDDPIVQTALYAKADYLVTADKAILAVRKVRDVKIVTLSQFESTLTSLT